MLCLCDLYFSELHTFVATYVALSGLKFPGNEFVAAATLDGQQISYWNKTEKKLFPKQDWMKRIESKGLLGENTLIRENVQQIYINTIHDLMQQMHQSNGELILNILELTFVRHV